MSFFNDPARLGWFVVGGVLLMSGLRHVSTQQLLGRVHLSGGAPLAEGWFVVLVGVAELIAGALLVSRSLRTR
jgi:hypothetical protein